VTCGARRVVIVGGRPDGHGRVVIETARATQDVKVMGFLDDAPCAPTVAGAAWLGRIEESIERCRDQGMSFHIAIGHNPTRRRLAGLIVALGGTLATLVHPRAIIFESAVIGQGTLVAAGAVVGPGARVGTDCIVNHGALVEHDAVLADHVNVSSGFVSGGRIRLEEGVFAGIGASVLPDVVVGRWAFLGAGAVVVSDATPHSLYVGVPARRVRVLGTDEAPRTP